MANINWINTGAEHRRGELYTYEAEAYKFMGTHTARRTFISNSILEGKNPEIVKKVSGHSTNSTFSRYNRLGRKEAVNAYLESNKNKENKSDKVVVSNDYVKDIDEAKRVLGYLGVDACEFLEINDFSKLLVLIGREESKIIDLIGIDNMDKVKDIFNEFVTLKEKKVLLQKLIKELNNVK